MPQLLVVLNAGQHLHDKSRLLSLKVLSGRAPHGLPRNSQDMPVIAPKENTSWNEERTGRMSGKTDGAKRQDILVWMLHTMIGLQTLRWCSLSWRVIHA